MNRSLFMDVQYACSDTMTDILRLEVNTFIKTVFGVQEREKYALRPIEGLNQQCQANVLSLWF